MVRLVVGEDGLNTSEAGDATAWNVTWINQRMAWKSIVLFIPTE
jgi:hypothetical protein